MCRVLNKKLWIPVVIGLAVVLIVAGIRFWPHLLWRFGGGYSLTLNQQLLPVSPMPETPVPDDFVRCHFGPLEFRVPPGTVAKPEFKAGGLPHVVLRDGKRDVLVTLPSDNRTTL